VLFVFQNCLELSYVLNKCTKKRKRKVELFFLFTWMCRKENAKLGGTKTGGKSETKGRG